MKLKFYGVRDSYPVHDDNKLSEIECYLERKLSIFNVQLAYEGMEINV